MYACGRKHSIVLASLVSISLVSGCTNWQQKYEYLNVEHENLKGRYEKLQADSKGFVNGAAESQATIDELTRQLEELRKSGSDGGFGPGADVSFQPGAGTITVSVKDDILFASGSATLKGASISELDNITSVIKSKYSGRLIDVIGHTDSDPIRKSKFDDNWQLSAERALAVLRYLIKGGIPDNQIRSIGRGASMPRVDNSSSANKARNRRVEIVVHMK